MGLTLSRKRGQRIRARAALAPGVFVDLWIEVREIDRNKVRLSFEAPREVTIMREELIERVPAKESA